MKIKLIRMSITNFKGIKNLEINFDGENTNIYGENATGKTSIFDAFLWVLFNKNSVGDSKFGYKPFELDGNVIHFLNTEVEVTLQIDNLPKTFKKVLTENWVKKRGNSERTYAGDENNYWIDEVPMQENEFKKVIDSIINEKQFRMLTNPLYFNTQLSEDEQRQTISRIAGIDAITDEKIFDKNSDYTELRNKLNGRTVEDYSKVVNEAIKKLNKEIETVPIRIDEITRTLISVDDRDVKDANEEIKKLENEKVNINNYLTDIRTRVAKNNKLISKLAQKEIEKEQLIKQIIKEANADIYEQRSSLETHLERFKSDIKIANSNIQIAQNTLLRKNEIEQLRKDFDVESSKKFIDENNYICPGCGREFDENRRQEMFQVAKNNFIEFQNKKLDEINLKGQELNKLISSAENDLKESQEKLRIAGEQVKVLSEKLATIHDKEVNVEIDSRYIAIEKEIKTLRVQVDSIVNEDTSKNENKLKDLDNKILENKQVLNKKESQISAENRIEELKKEERELANQIQEYEALKDMMENFTKEKITLLESTINEHFEVVNFKLFETQKNGGLKEVCYATVNGVPFSDLNSAMKINAGLDIIKTLMKFYDVQAPVFIDNKETINNLIEIDTQLISLIVSTDKKLKVEVSHNVRN